MTEMRNTGRTRASYTSPRAKVVEISAQGVLCGSGDQYGYPTEFEEQNL